MRIASVGHVVFAAAIIILGVVGLINGGFAGVWQPVPKSAATREVLIYLCAFISHLRPDQKTPSRGAKPLSLCR